MKDGKRKEDTAQNTEMAQGACWPSPEAPNGSRGSLLESEPLALLTKEALSANDGLVLQRSKHLAALTAAATSSSTNATCSTSSTAVRPCPAAVGNESSVKNSPSARVRKPSASEANSRRLSSVVRKGRT